jgi:hypothetical protein
MCPEGPDDCCGEEWRTLGAMGSRGAIHHLELWVSDIDAADTSLGWLLHPLGWLLHALGYHLVDT